MQRQNLLKGYDGGENLSTYREGCLLVEGKIPVDEAIAFDIERFVSPSMTPEYSMMINGYYHGKRPTRADFAKRVGELDRVSELDSFVLTGDEPEFLCYDNLGRNILVDRIPHNYGKSKIGIGVVQRNRIPELRVVVGEVVPYAVSVFNQLSPTWKLRDDIVRKSIELALESDKKISEAGKVA